MVMAVAMPRGAISSPVVTMGYPSSPSSRMGWSTRPPNMPSPMSAMTSDDMPKLRSLKMRMSKMAFSGWRSEWTMNTAMPTTAASAARRMSTASNQSCWLPRSNTYCRPAMPIAMNPKPNQSMRRARRGESGTNCEARNNERRPTGRLM
jgi:hypothetical protein